MLSYQAGLGVERLRRSPTERRSGLGGDAGQCRVCGVGPWAEPGKERGKRKRAGIIQPRMIF